MELVDRPTVQSSAADLAEELKSRSAADAAARLASFSGLEIAAVLMRLSPGFAQDVLGALPDEARERALAAATPEVSRQWQRNALYEPDAIGRMMEPALAAFSHQRTVGETIEQLREMVKSALITYVYVVDPAEYLLGIVTMRDLLFSDRDRLLSEVMFRDVFALHAAMPLTDAMKLVLDRHYPVYPVVDAERRLLGLVRGHSMFEAQAIEITLQAGSMVGVEKEERLATPWLTSLRLRHPWLQLNLLTAFLAAAVVGIFQDTIDRLVILALFLPVLAGQSGNTGCQALAVTLRGLTLGELKPGAERALVTKEAWLGCLNGAGVGLFAGLGMYLTATGQESAHPVMLALVVFLAMIGSCIASGISGAMVVMEQGRMVGMLTFHELLRALASHGGALGELRVGDIMVRDPVTAAPEMEVNDLRRTMLESGARYLPVMQDGRLLGVISFRDVAKAVLEEQDFENKMLKGYIKNWPA